MINFSYFYGAGDFDRTSPGTVTISTSNNLSTPQISESPHSGSMNNGMPESETEKVEETVEEEKKDIDPLDKFLPPPPKEKCSEDLQVSFLSDIRTTYVLRKYYANVNLDLVKKIKQLWMDYGMCLLLFSFSSE